MHLPLSLSLVTLLAASVAAAPLAGAPAPPTLALRLIQPPQPPTPTALPTIGVIKKPTVGGGYYLGAKDIDFVFLKPTSPGFTVKYINVNLNTKDSTHTLATNLSSHTSEISARLLFPPRFFQDFVKGEMPGFIQVTEFDAPRPGYDGGAIYPPPKEINLINHQTTPDTAGPKPVGGPKPVAGPKPVGGPKPVAGPPVVPVGGKPSI